MWFVTEEIINKRKDERTIHTSYIVNSKFENDITFLTGISGTGKMVSFSFIRECMALNPDILCINYLDYQKDIKK